MKHRIWELDALRGICILGMVVVHLGYDLGKLYNLSFTRGFLFVQNWGGVLFLLISGICVTLGHHHLKRGLIVFACGMLCTAVTAGIVGLGFADKSLMIYFGILHCLGLCMLLWSIFRRLPVWALALTGLAVIAAGFYCNTHVVVSFPWLIGLGIVFPGFVSSDYFPLLPNLGFFLLGSALGRSIYRAQVTHFPKTNDKTPVIRFLCSCGRASLPIYLLHQPVITTILTLISLF